MNVGDRVFFTPANRAKTVENQRHGVITSLCGGAEWVAVKYDATGRTQATAIRSLTLEPTDNDGQLDD